MDSTPTWRNSIRKIRELTGGDGTDEVIDWVGTRQAGRVSKHCCPRPKKGAARPPSRATAKHAKPLTSTFTYNSRTWPTIRPVGQRQLQDRKRANVKGR